MLGRDGSTAIEVKGGANVRPGELRALRAFMEEHRPRHAIVVSNEDAPRQTDDGIRILPGRKFLELLWTDAIVD